MLVERLEQRCLLTVQVGPLTTVAGQTFNGQVATFAAGDLQGTLANFQATINWGGGLSPTTAGTITPNGLGGYIVTGSNVYPKVGTYSVTVNLSGANNSAASGSGTATVLDAPLTTTPVTVNAVRGTAFSGVVATFQSSNPYATTGDFSATINWGDGVNTSAPGTIGVNSSGGFDVVGQNTYQTDGTLPITVSITSPGGQVTVVNSTANVTDLPISVFPMNVFAGVNQPIAGVTVATFSDPYSTDTAANFQASVNWGDGTNSAGVISVGPNGIFTVTSTKPSSYTAASTYTVDTQIVRISTDQTAMSSGEAVITSTAPVLIPTGVLLVKPAGVPFNNVTVGTFTDSKAGAPNANFTAEINWSNGQTSPGTVTLVSTSSSSSLFSVTGSNLYTTPGTYAVSVLVNDNQGNSTTINSTAIATGPVLTPVSTLLTATAGVALPSTTVVGSFLDSTPNVPASDFTASIKWGDDQTSQGLVTFNATTGLFNVTSGHLYATPGTFSPTILVQDNNGQSTTITSTIVVSSPITATGATFTATLGQLANVTVASFIDSDTNAASSTAVINWGDEQSSPGKVNPTGTPGVFIVTGTHTYSIASTTGSYPVTVTIADPEGQTAMASGTAIVAAPTIVATGTTFYTALGQVLTGVTVANFTDSNSTANSGNITAIIKWDDGQTTTGTVNPTTTPDLYTVTGTHTYSMASATGSFAITVTIIDPSGQTATANSTAITTAFLNASGTTFSVTPGQAFTTTVANFTDTNPAFVNNPTPKSLPTAVINWGDGQSSSGSVTLVSSTSSGGTFTVTGMHTYATSSQASSYAVTVTIIDPSGQTATASSTAVVFTLTVLTPVPATVNFTTGVLPSGPVTIGSFFDSNTGDLASQFTATIAWGDGNASAGMVTKSSTTPGLFLVTGAHLYAASGNYTSTILVQDQTGHTTTITSTAVVTSFNANGNASGLTGGLADSITNGPHAAIGFTNTNRPTFNGTAAPYSIVQVYARHFNADAELPVGEAVANGNGQWTLTTGPLAVGAWIFTATVTVPGGYPSNMITLTNTAGTDLVYIDLTPRLVRQLTHGQKAVPHPRMSIPHPKASRPKWVGHHKP